MLIGGIMALICLTQSDVTPDQPRPREMLVNDGWEFSIGSRWELVTLPHTPRIEQPDKAKEYFRGTCQYRKTFTPEPWQKGKRVYLRFDGAMHTANVFVNGELATTHYGGYLPFTVDLTESLSKGPAKVAVELSNSDDPNVPPGKPSNGVDFCYFGGIYRNVWMVTTGNSFFTEATNVVLFTEGGIRVTTKKLSGKAAEISVGTQVRVHGPGVRPVQVRNIVFDAKGKEVCRKDWSVSSSPATPTPDSEYSCNSSDTLQIANPKPWSPDSPNLYTLRSQLLENGKVVDQVDTKFGIKRMEIRKDGFYLNGKLTKPRGANRHQDYPWLGNAAPDNAQERDIKLLKESGFNFLRLAHYPQSKAVMDACDKCGVMVSVCVPGWQHYSSDPVFTEHVHEDLRNMVRLHRNHPSVIMWEVTLNETYAPGDEFVKECVDIAREEADGDQFFTCGDTFGKKDVKFIGYDIPYSGWRDFYDRPAHPTAPDKLYFHREYGDYEFGGESSTSRVSRGSSEEALMLQAWNHQWAHNVNWSLPYTLGDAIWAGIDHFRGFADNSSISRCGAIDYLRLPKIVASFHKSQLAPSAKPVVEIAGYWTPRPSPTKVVVYSNCDEVELLLNGKSLGRQKPDHGPDSEYGVWRPEADPMYWTKGGDSKAATEEALKNAQGQPASKTMFDRGNCRHLDHPPFSFMPVTFEPGKLEAVGFIAGKEVARSNLATPGKAAKLKLAADLHGVPLSKVGLDAVFIRAYILDAKGTVVNEAQADVRFAVTGPAEIVGIAPVEAGIASALIRTKPGAGKVEVTAKADGFKPVSIVLKKS